MPKESHCRCAVCQVEQSLLNSLSTQIARNQFQALAFNHPILTQFDSPADVIAQLHGQAESENHEAWNEILHALLHCIAERSGEDIGQQLLLAAYAPAIHKVYREVCQKFPGLSSEDIAQQATVCFLETARSAELQTLNGHVPAALSRRFRQRLFRWAIGELQQSRPLEAIVGTLPASPTFDFEEGIVLEQLLSKAQRMGILSASECELVRKFHLEGFQPEELRENQNGPSAIALYYRIQRAVHRLRRIGATGSPRAGALRSHRKPPRSESKENLAKDARFLREDVH